MGTTTSEFNDFNELIKTIDTRDEALACTQLHRKHQPWLPRDGSAVAVIVAYVSIDDAREMIAALAEPDVMLVFGVIVAATSKARVVDDFGRPVAGTSYLTIFGLMKKTTMPQDVIMKATERLVRVGLLDVLSDERRGYDSWRVNEAALAGVST